MIVRNISVVNPVVLRKVLVRRVFKKKGEDFDAPAEFKTLLFLDWNIVDPGAIGVPHSHPTREEIYCIIKGEGIMLVGSEEKKVKEGDIIYIPQGQEHRLKNISKEPITFLCTAAEV